jgi:hypothetical protein
MNTLAEKIHTEVRRLPDDLARQVYEFICFVEQRHGIQPLAEESPAHDWGGFFDRHTRTVGDATPLSRDEVYADRLR